jgi:amphi-Trp domain-containing protein
MPEETIFESESVQSRAEVAAYLRTVAENLDAGDPVTLRANGETVTLDPPPSVTFETKAEREGPTDGAGELSLELELEWDEAETEGTAGLEIE